MNKLKIENLIVVEGKTDIDFLSSFIDGNFYSVNGSAISKEDLEYLEKVNKINKIIVLTDPDFPGKQIRDTINNYLNYNVYNAYVRKEFSIKNHKVGVAESTKDEVIRALNNLVEFNSIETSSNLNYFDLIELNLVGENSNDLRNEFTNFYNLGHSNGKKLLKKLKLLGINKSELEKMMNYVKTR